MIYNPHGHGWKVFQQRKPRGVHIHFGWLALVCFGLAFAGVIVAVAIQAAR